jgi:hypothetical protein
MTRSQLEQSIFANIAVWNTSGLGSPNVLPVNHPVFWFWHYAAMLVSPSAVLKITLVCAFATLALGITALARRLTGLPLWAATVIGIWSLLGPAIFAKFLAGHVYYLLSIAAFPWCAYLFLKRIPTARAALGAGVVAALMIIQPQLYVVAIATFVCIALFCPERRKAAIIAIPVSLLLAVPAIYLAITVGTSGVELPAIKTVQSWEYNNSAHPLDAVIALGYFPGYAERAYALAPLGWIARGMLYLIPALAILGVLTNVKSRIVLVLSSLWLLTFFLVCGLYGPLAVPLSIAFASWPLFSIFRELFHFAGPMWLFVCVLAAFGLANLQQRLRVLAALAGTVAVIALWVPAHFGGQLYSWQADAATRSTVQTIAQRPGDDRFLALPARTPVAPAGMISGGENPFAYATGSHPFANEYSVSPQLDLALFYVRDKDARARRWLDALGIGSCFVADSLHSVFRDSIVLPKRWPKALPSVQRLLSVPVTCPEGISSSPQAVVTNSLQVVRSPLDWNSGALFLIDTDTLANTRDLVRPSPSELTTDPSRDWVRSYLWSWVSPKIAAAGTGGAVTWSTAPLSVPSFPTGRTAAKVYVFNGSLFTDRGIEIPTPQKAFSWIVLPQGTRSLHYQGDGFAIAGAFAAAPLLPHLRVTSGGSTRVAAASFHSQSLTAYGQNVDANFWIVLKQRFSPFWHADVDGGTVLRHVVAGGYANAWYVRCSHKCGFQISYEPARIAWLLLYGSLAVWVLAALASAIRLKIPSKFSSLSR